MHFFRLFIKYQNHLKACLSLKVVLNYKKVKVRKHPRMKIVELALKTFYDFQCSITKFFNLFTKIVYLIDKFCKSSFAEFFS